MPPASLAKPKGRASRRILDASHDLHDTRKVTRAIALALLFVLVLCGRECAANTARWEESPQSFSPLDVIKHVAVRIERSGRVPVTLHRFKAPPAHVTETVNALAVARASGSPGLA